MRRPAMSVAGVFLGFGVAADLMMRYSFLAKFWSCGICVSWIIAICILRFSSCCVISCCISCVGNGLDSSLLWILRLSQFASLGLPVWVFLLEIVVSGVILGNVFVLSTH